MICLPSSARRRLIGDSARLLARRSPSRRFGPRRASRRPAATRQRGSGRMRQGRREKIASRASARRFPARHAAARAFAQPAKDSPVPPAICSACRSSSSLLLVPAGQATLLLVPTGGGRRHCSPPPVELVGRSRCSSSTRAAPGIPTGDGARVASHGPSKVSSLPRWLLPCPLPFSFLLFPAGCSLPDPCSSSLPRQMLLSPALLSFSMAAPILLSPSPWPLPSI